MIPRSAYFDQVMTALGRSPVTALLGPRQCGKTTLARMVSQGVEATHFHLESQQDLARLQNPELALSSARELVIIDEIQRMPELLGVLRVIVDRPANTTRFLILGGASADVVKNVSESLAGWIQFVDLSGFNIEEVGAESAPALRVRGGFPRSFLAETEEDSIAW